MIRSALGWCSLINMGLLLFWYLLFVFAHDWIYRFHRKQFNISKEGLETVHYAGMAFFKIGIFLLPIVPYLALRIVG